MKKAIISLVIFVQIFCIFGIGSCYATNNTGEIIPEFIKKYNQEGQDLVEQDIEKIKGIKFLQRDLSMIIDGHIRHDPNLVATSIIELICDDLKYQDKQNDPQYLMLSTKLREDKRINKMKKHAKKASFKKANAKNLSKNTKRKSKFSNKYSERIASIREADEKLKRKTTQEKRKKEKISLINPSHKVEKNIKKDSIDKDKKKLDNFINKKEKKSIENIYGKKEIKNNNSKYDVKNNKKDNIYSKKENINKLNNSRQLQEKKYNENTNKVAQNIKPKNEVNKVAQNVKPKNEVKKTPQQIREEMLRKLEESRLK